MGMETVVYGFIYGPHWPHQEIQLDDPRLEIHQKFREEVQHNLSVIAMLPEEDDEWPYLSRNMFSSSTPSFQTTYKSQIIHFGASFKNIEWEWDEWLIKFEAVLRTMYWDEVRVHLVSEMFTSSFHYSWERAFSPDRDQLETDWTFSGEPRTFLPFLQREEK